MVKGFLNKRNFTILRLVLEQVTWYEARKICILQGFGSLDNSSHTSMRTSMITGALTESFSCLNQSLWTGFFLGNMSDNSWFSTRSESDCFPIELNFNTTHSEYRCAINKYNTANLEPTLEMRNCSERNSFVCKVKEERTSFTRYTGYDVIYTPPGSNLYTDYYGLSNCIEKCRKAGFCIGFSYHGPSGQCRRVRADFGVQALEYEIVYLSPDVSHYTKDGFKVTIIENSSYIVEMEEEVGSFECFTSSENVSYMNTTTTNSSYNSETISPTSPSITSTVDTGITSSNAMLSTEQGFNTSCDNITLTPTVLSISDSINNDNSSICICLNSVCEMSLDSLEKIKEVIRIIEKNLTIKRKDTKHYKRTLECALDNRTSARAMGYVASIVMCLVFGPIVISDIIRIVRQIKEKKHCSYIEGVRKQRK